jgi:tetratricopeptide (TPR) repeat protein
VVARCAGRDVPNLVEETDRFAETLAAAKRYAHAAMVAEPAVATARQVGRPDLFWRIADHLSYYLERTGRLEEAMGLWREAIDAGSNIPRIFDRLSLALDRAGNPRAAARVCDVGMERFSNEARRTRLVQQIAKRGQRCHANGRLMNKGPPT